MLIWIPPGNKMLLLEHIKRFLLSITFCCRLQIGCVLYKIRYAKLSSFNKTFSQDQRKIDQIFISRLHLPSVYHGLNTFLYIYWYATIIWRHIVPLAFFKLLCYWFLMQKNTNLFIKRCDLHRKLNF